MNHVHRNQLFFASCLALVVTSLSFGIRAGILETLGMEFGLDRAELGTIAATAFWGFPLAVIAGGFVVDLIGMKRLLVLAFVLHLAGILLTIFASGFWTLFLSTLIIGIANGTVEAACNPLVTALYPENKTTKLNHFHLWFPGGIVIGTLISFGFDQLGWNWQLKMATMILPTLLYGALFLRLRLPVTERVAIGVSTKEMYRSLLHPLFLFMLLCILGTAITELFTGQWIQLLLGNVTQNAILILTLTTGVMALGRGFAGPVVHRLSPQGVLLASAILSTLGLYLLGNTTGNLLILGALIFGMGVCYFWPTLLGFVSENLPKTGAVGINLLSGAGMLAVSLYMMVMGGVYDRLIQKQLPLNADITLYNTPDATPEMKAALAAANKAAGPEIINTTLVIPVALIVAFAALNLYMRRKMRKPQPVVS
jgi:MFS family permease